MPGEWRLPLMDGGRYRFERATPEAVDYVARNLRPADQRELYASRGHSDFPAILRMCVAGTEDAVVGMEADGTPQAVFGVTNVSLIYNIGCPWMLCTERAQLYRSALVAAGRFYTAAMLEHYEVLENRVDARNTKCVAWLRHLGYTIAPAQPHGALQLPFHHFYLVRR